MADVLRISSIGSWDLQVWKLDTTVILISGYANRARHGTFLLRFMFTVFETQIGICKGTLYHILFSGAQDDVCAGRMHENISLQSQSDIPL